MVKVVWISSYLPRSCGIAYYSEDYIDALREYARKSGERIIFKIVAHTDAVQSDYPIIDNEKDKNWHKKVFKVIQKEKPDLVHIQHEYGLYETNGDNNKRVLELIEMLKNAGVPSVMTYHSVYETLEPYMKEFVDKAQKLLSVGIFHEDYQKKALKKNIGYIPDNIEILPHGSNGHVKVNRKKARDVFGYDSQLIVGTAGLASERKGFRTLIHQWPKVVKKFPNAILALEVKPDFSKESKEYIDKVLEEIMDSKVMNNIELVVKDYSEKEFYRRLASFDILVLPYRSESQSGVLAHGFSVGAPAVVTDIEGLGAEIRNSNAGIAVKDRDKFYKAIIKLLKSKKLREKYSRNALKYVKNVNGWSIIAKKTFKIYDKIKKIKNKK